MRILVVGGGGREHALCWKLAQSPGAQVWCAPGNPGIAEVATCVPIAATAIAELVAFARTESIELTVVGPEQPLALGIVDAFRAAGLRIFGPTQAAARLESSKVFSKEFMTAHGIPTAQFATFTDTESALTHLETKTESAPIVVKQDGLAAGKGVVVAHNRLEAEQAVRQFGASTESPLVIEEFLAGEEISCIAISDGTRFALLPPSQDHKRIGDGDTGPNTGGMGAVSPVRRWTPALQAAVCEHVIAPVISGMRAAGTPFCGFLYAGLMIVGDTPYVLEFNTRLGDPETQAILPRVQNDLATLLTAAADGALNMDTESVPCDPRTTVCVVLASAGYPSTARTGDVISQTSPSPSDDTLIFHAGTALRKTESGVMRHTNTVQSAKTESAQLVTSGGRVLVVTAFGDSVSAARARAYQAVAGIAWNGMQYRTDIGSKQLD